jgi:hypothetical protein
MDSQVYAEKFDSAANRTTNYFLTAPGTVQSIAYGFTFASNLIPELFVRGMDSQVWEQKLTAAGDPATSFFLAAPGAVQSLSVTVHVVAGTTLRAEVFALGLDNQVYGLKLAADGTPVSPFFLTSPGMVVSFTASVVNNGGGMFSPEVFALGLDHQVYALRFSSMEDPMGTFFLTAPGMVQP